MHRRPPFSHRCRRVAAVAALLALVAAPTACADIKALASLSAAIQREYHTPANLNVGNGRLTILFTKAPDAKLAPDDQEAFARGVARFARDHFTGGETLTEIRVGLVQTSGLGPLTMTKTSVPYRFLVSELDDTTRTSVAGPAQASSSPPPGPSTPARR